MLLLRRKQVQLACLQIIKLLFEPCLVRIWVNDETRGFIAFGDIFGPKITLGPGPLAVCVPVRSTIGVEAPRNQHQYENKANRSSNAIGRNCLQVKIDCCNTWYQERRVAGSECGRGSQTNSSDRRIRRENDAVCQQNRRDEWDIAGIPFAHEPRD